MRTLVRVQGPWYTVVAAILSHLGGGLGAERECEALRRDAREATASVARPPGQRRDAPEARCPAEGQAEPSAWARFLERVSDIEAHDDDAPDVWARFLARVTALLHGDEGGNRL